MSDKILFIDKDEMPDHLSIVLSCKSIVLACKRFIHYLVIKVLWGSLSVGVYNYAIPGSIYDCIVLFKVARDASYEIQSVVEDIADAYQKAPIFLSKQETSDYFASVLSQTDVNKNLAVGILQVIILDGTHLAHSGTTVFEKMLYRDIQQLII